MRERVLEQHGLVQALALVQGEAERVHRALVAAGAPVEVGDVHEHDGEGDELLVAQARHEALEVGAGERAAVHELVEAQQRVSPQVGGRIAGGKGNERHRVGEPGHGRDLGGAAGVRVEDAGQRVEPAGAGRGRTARLGVRGLDQQGAQSGAGTVGDGTRCGLRRIGCFLLRVHGVPPSRSAHVLFLYLRWGSRRRSIWTGSAEDGRCSGIAGCSGTGRRGPIMGVATITRSRNPGRAALRPVRFRPRADFRRGNRCRRITFAEAERRYAGCNAGRGAAWRAEDKGTR